MRNYLTDSELAFFAHLKELSPRIETGELQESDPFPEDVVDVEDDEEG